MKTSFFFAALAVLFLPFAALAQRAGETIVVIASGVGDSVQSAEKAAFREAVQKTVGQIIDARTVVENDQLLEDRILTFGNGMVESYETIEGPSRTADGLYSIKIRAVVRKDQVSDRVRGGVNTDGNIDGGGLFAELITRKDAMKDATAMLRDVFSDAPRNVLTAEVMKNANGSPQVKLEHVSGNLQVAVSLRVDPERYEKWADELERILSMMAAGEKKTWTSSSYGTFNHDRVHNYMLSAGFPAYVFVLRPTKRISYEFTFENNSMRNSFFALRGDMASTLAKALPTERLVPVVTLTIKDRNGHSLVTKSVRFLSFGDGTCVVNVQHMGGNLGSRYEIAPVVNFLHGDRLQASVCGYIDMGVLSEADIRAAHSFDCSVSITKE